MGISRNVGILRWLVTRMGCTNNRLKLRLSPVLIFSAIFAALAFGGAARASTITLAGFEDWPDLNSSGTTTIGSSNYFYSDNNADVGISKQWSSQPLTETSPTSAGPTSWGPDFVLSLGANTFTFNGGAPAPTGDYPALGFFFTGATSGDGGSYNPSSLGASPNLAVVDANVEGTSSSFNVVPAGSSDVADYGNANKSTPGTLEYTSYSGASSYTDPTSGLTVTLSAVNFTTTGGGFTLTVTPEPSTLGIAGAAMTVLGLRRRKR